MKLKKFAALMLAILALVSVFAGCGKKEEEENIYPGKYGLAYNKFAPDEVIMTVGDSDVTWQEFYFYMTSAVIDIENAFGLSSITDWTESATDDLTIEEYVMTSAVENAKYYHTIVSMAPELGVEVTEEDEAVVDSLVDKGIEQAGSQEAFEENLKEGYVNLDFFKEYYTMYYLSSKCLKAVYGDNCEKLSDDEALVYAEENNYYRAKHILLKTVDDSNQAISDEEKAEKLAQAQSLLDQLNASEDPIALFDELIAEYGEDPGMTSYPDGYVFTEGSMVSEFYDATAALEENQYSGIVESDYGYHIILRLPIDPDLSVVGDSSGNTLRMLTAFDRFGATVQGWMDSIDVAYADAYDQINLSELYVPRETDDSTDTTDTTAEN